MIYEQFNTKQDLDALVANLHRFRLDLFEYSGTDLEVRLHNEYSLKFATLLREVLSKNNLDLATSEKLQIEGFLNQIEDEITNVEVLELTLAFDPSERFLAEVQNWVSKNVKDGTLLDLKTDTALIGGAVLVYKGFYKDFSLSNKLDGYNFTL